MWWIGCLNGDFAVSVCWGLPYAHTIRGNCYWKMTSKQAFSSSMWHSAHISQRKIHSLEEVLHQQKVCFQASIKNSLDSKRSDPQGCLEDLTSRVMALCFPTLSVAWKNIPMLYLECLWRNRLQECVWKCWLPYCGYPEDVTFNWKWASS